MTELAQTSLRGRVSRLAAALAGGMGGAVIAAALDARSVRAAESQAPPFGPLFVAELALITPIALAVGVAVGLGALFLHPRQAPSFGVLSRALTPADVSRRASIAVGLPLGAIAVAIWIVLSARLALSGLAADSAPKPAGAAIALGSALTALLLIALVAGGTRALSARLAERAPDPRLSAAIGLGLALGLIGYAIASGTTSGAGGTLAIFGVFKRPELDLRAPGLLLLIALSAYLLPAALARAPIWALALPALLPLGLTLQQARALDAQTTALSIERSAPLGKIALGRLQKLSDRDKDGASARFGGGDCDDDNPAIGPHADDAPGNGKDEDCSGKDAEKVDLQAAQSEVPKDAKTFVAEHLPEKLNVVVITVDTLRYDLGYMGYERKISPNIDALAKKSTVFEKAYALASYTSKSLAPMLIGKYGSETHRGWSHFNRFEPEDIFIQERLQKAGIRTLSVQGYW